MKRYNVFNIFNFQVKVVKYPSCGYQERDLAARGQKMIFCGRVGRLNAIMFRSVSVYYGVALASSV